MRYGQSGNVLSTYDSLFMIKDLPCIKGRLPPSCHRGSDVVCVGIYGDED